MSAPGPRRNEVCRSSFDPARDGRLVCADASVPCTVQSSVRLWRKGVPARSVRSRHLDMAGTTRTGGDVGAEGRQAPRTGTRARGAAGGGARRKRGRADCPTPSAPATPRVAASISVVADDFTDAFAYAIDHGLRTFRPRDLVSCA